MDSSSIQLKTLFSSVAIVLTCEAIGAVTGLSGHLPGIGILRLLEIVGILFLVFQMEKNLTCIGIGRSGIFSALKRGLLWAAGFGILAAVAALLLFLSDQNPLRLIRVPLPSEPLSLSLYFSVGGVIGPVAEEIFFRGLVFRFFRRWGFFFSLFFSTAIFAGMHPMSSGIPVFQIAGGILFATAFEIEKSLLVPVIIHILGNLAIFSLSLLSY